MTHYNKSELPGDSVISKIVGTHGVTSAQMILRWNPQKGVAVIPSPSNPDHIKDHLNIFGFELTDEEMQKMKYPVSRPFVLPTCFLNPHFLSCDST